MESQTMPSARRGWVFQVAAFTLVLVSAVAGTGLARWLAPPTVAPTVPPTAGKQPQPAPRPRLDLNTWPKPDVTLFLTAQMHGYILPCGCSRPQIGGLERRFNFLQMIKDKSWQILPLDLGDIAQKEGPAKLPNIQGLIKYKYSMRALKILGYTSVGFGEYEAALPSFEALGAILNDPAPPIMLGNLEDPKGEMRQSFAPHLSRWRIVEDLASKSRFGVTAIIGSGVEARIKDSELKLQASQPALDTITREMDQANLDFRIAIYHGSLTRGLFAQGKDAEAVELAKAYPKFDVILCLSEEAEPPANPKRVEHPGGRKTLVLATGHKGRYIGVLGLYKKPGGWDTKWELVEMSEDFMTPPAKEKGHPISDLLESYTKDLRDQNFLARVPQIKHSSQVAIAGKVPTFVGSDKCKKCHEKAYDIWKKTPHHHAYDTLVTKADRPSNRQYDPECIVCHTVGFGYESGYRDEKTTPNLKDVGCESCHGPCSDHTKDPLNAAWYPVINPYRPAEKETPEQKKKRLGRVDQFCQKCHDIDNDVKWSEVGFDKKWAKIAHPTLDE